MTKEVTEFRCRTCGHILGEEEHRHALSNYYKDRQAIREELSEELANKYEEEMQQERAEHQRKEQQLQREKQQQQGEFDRELQNRVELGIQSRMNDICSEEQEKHQQEIRKKDEVIESLKSQNEQAISEAVVQALRRRDDEWRREEKQYQEHIDRVEKHNRELQNTLESIPPERKGTSGEKTLIDDLHDAFPQDDLIFRRVGEEMPDVVQFVVTESRERIATPILWDMKTGDNITPKDIEKAKSYKEKYNTDYCFIVASKPKCIREKDCKNTRAAGIIGKRNGILLVHQSVAMDIAEETRKFITEKARLLKNNSGRTSKQADLYDYITSPERLRKIERKMEKMTRLEKSIRLLENHSIESWKEQRKLIGDLISLDEEDQERINDITQHDQANEGEDRPERDKEDR